MIKKRLLIHPDELTPKWIARMKAAKVDVLGLHPVGGAEARDSAAALLALLEKESFRNLLDAAAEAGLSIEYEMHAAGYLLPRELFASHPAYFRMDAQGKRSPDWNFCPSCPEALEYVANRAAELARKLYRSAQDYYFWLDDAKESRCHCPACQGLSASDQQLLVMNRILKKLRETQPGARLAYLAYFGCAAPPEKVKPEPGIFLEYAPFERDFAKSVRETAPEARKAMADLLEVFGKEGARVLEYWYDNSLFSKWKKPPVPFSPNNAMIKDDIRYYVQAGFREIGSFACYLGPDYEALYGEPDLSGFAAV